MSFEIGHGSVTRIKTARKWDFLHPITIPVFFHSYQGEKSSEQIKISHLTYTTGSTRRNQMWTAWSAKRVAGPLACTLHIWFCNVLVKGLRAHTVLYKKGETGISRTTRLPSAWLILSKKYLCFLMKLFWCSCFTGGKIVGQTMKCDNTSPLANPSFITNCSFLPL